MHPDHWSPTSAARRELGGDPPDRFIVATALKEKAPLLAKDVLLRELAWLRTIW
jgi:PIN domain nuclease of toxin-antitoxin system